MDFDDMIVNTVKLLEENEEVRTRYQNRFRYVMVDEYQDTNITVSAYQLLPEAAAISAWWATTIRAFTAFEALQ